MELAPWHTVLFFAANCLYILAYMVTNIVWLRILTVAAAMITLPYFFFQHEPLWSALFWQSMFALVNIFHLILLYIKSLPTKLTAFESRIKTLVFRTLPVSDIRKILEDAQIKTFDSGESILRQGQKNSDLYIVLRGGCSVHKEGKRIAHLLPGQFIGEMSFLTENTVSADVIAEQSTEIVSWKRNHLNKVFQKNTSLHKYFAILLGNDLAQKLSTA